MLKIPLPSPTVPEAGSSQSLISVKEIREDVIILKGGGLRSVIMVSGINFALKSKEEQEQTIGSFVGFINSLNFFLQIIVHNRFMDINEYANWVRQNTAGETNELIKVQTEEYMEFIKSFVEMYHIITKRFYVVVPYQQINLVKGKSHQIEEGFAIQKTQLRTRTEETVTGLEKLGLKAAILETEDLIELFYNLYNPSLAGERKFIYSEQK